MKNKKLAKMFPSTGAAKRAKMGAYHESGHRYLEWTISARCNTVSIMSGKTKNGGNYTGISKSLMSSHNLFNAPMVYHAISGRAAVEACLPKADQDFVYNTDFKELSELYALDDETILMHKWRKRHSTFNPEKFYERFKTPLIKQFRSRRTRRAIKALADALLKYGTLSGRESIKILEKAYGKPYPPGALPASLHSEITDGPPKSFNDCIASVNILANAIREYIMPLRNDERNDEKQNAILERIYRGTLCLKIWSSPDEEKKDQPS